MLDVGFRAGLGDEACLLGGILGQLCIEDAKRDGPVDGDLDRFVNMSPAFGREQGVDLESAERGVDALRAVGGELW